VQRLTLGTLMMSALFLAGCGGGTGSFSPHAGVQTGPASAGRNVKSLRDGLAAGDMTAACGTAFVSGRARCSAYVLTPSGRAAAGLDAPGRAVQSVGAAVAPAGYGPADLQSAYGLTAAAKTKGGDAVVAIVDAFDNPRAEQDLAVYRARYGLPPCTTANKCFKKVNQAGRAGPLPPAPTTSDTVGWLVESSLDLDMVSANCPKCKIVLVESNDDFMNNLGAAVNAAASLGATSISNSYVAQESSTDMLPPSQGGLLSYYVHPGIAIVAGSGDFGYAYSGYSFGALIPAAFPSVVAVGGTELRPDPTTPRGWSETVWDGTGSGCSTVEPMPPWQTAMSNCTGVFTDAAGRSTFGPTRIYGDVSYVASTYTGVAVYDSQNNFSPNGWGVVGGTSASSPAIAAIYGLAGYGTSNGDGNDDDNGFPARKLYRTKHGLFDVTAGTNGDCSGTMLCVAGQGYDAPTGNGSPNGITAF
jgi:subtilase family serine protease